ncbi:hypothetical protein F5B20DRAFT_583677 [Whalleya microplaca]|nr:hypothetical protein F5B20DRAFT_583677 [Whalleya microplaca]
MDLDKSSIWDKYFHISEGFLNWNDPHPEMGMVCLLEADERREIFLVCPESYLEEEGAEMDLVGKTLKRYHGHLAPSVKVLKVSESGLLEMVSSDPQEVEKLRNSEMGIYTLAEAPHPRLADTTFSDWPTFKRTQLVELDRFKANVDLVGPVDNLDSRHVAKYIFSDTDGYSIWNEMNVLRSLPPHPSLIPLDRLVLDDEEHIIGMITKFVEGGDLKWNKTRPFKFRWIEQLTDTLDFLHWDKGIVHGDMQLKNILVDEAADTLVLCDFEMAAPISEERVNDELDTVMWSVYELITHDIKLRKVQYAKTRKELGIFSNNTDILNQMPDWPVNANLDCEGKRLREYITEWIQRHKEEYKSQARDPIEFNWDNHVPDDPTREYPMKKRIDWQRPPYSEAYPDRVTKKPHQFEGESRQEEKDSASNSDSGLGQKAADTPESEAKDVRDSSTQIEALQGKKRKAVDSLELSTTEPIAKRTRAAKSRKALEKSKQPSKAKKG